MTDVIVGIDARKATKGSKEAKRAFTQVELAALKPRNALGQFTKASNLTAVSMGNLGSRLRGLAATFGLFLGARAVINLLSEFEETMLTVQGVTGATAKQFEELSASARHFGATTRFSATEAGQGLLFLARAGFTVDEALEALPDTLDLAASSGIGLGEAADIASNVLAQFGLQTSGLTRVVDTLTMTANSSNTTVRQLAEAMKFVGPVAGALGIEIEEASAAIGVLGNAGIQASQAGTNLRGIMANLLSPTDTATAALKALGLELEDISPTTNTLTEIFKNFRDAGLSAEEALNIFGRRNAAAALLLARSSDEIKSLTDRNKEATGATKDLAELMASGLAGALKSMISAAQELFLTMGDGGLAGVLSETVTLLAEILRIVAGVDGAFGDASTAAQILGIAIQTLIGLFVGLALAKMIILFTKLATSIASASVSMSALNAAIVSNPLGAALVVLSTTIALVTALDNATSDLAQTEENRRRKNIEDLTQKQTPSVTALISSVSSLKQAQGDGDPTVIAAGYDRVSRALADVRTRFEEMKTAEQLTLGSAVEGTARLTKEFTNQLQSLGVDFDKIQHEGLETGGLLIQNTGQLIDEFKRLENGVGTQADQFRELAQAQRQANTFAADAIALQEKQRKAAMDLTVSLGAQLEHFDLLQQYENKSPLEQRIAQDRLDLEDQGVRSGLLDPTGAGIGQAGSDFLAKLDLLDNKKRAAAGRQGRRDFEDVLEGLERETELMKLNNDQREVAAALIKAEQLAKNAGIYLSEKQLGQLEEQVRLQQKLRDADSLRQGNLTNLSSLAGSTSISSSFTGAGESFSAGQNPLNKLASNTKRLVEVTEEQTAILQQIRDSASGKVNFINGSLN